MLSELAQIILAKKQKKMADKINPVYTPYAVNPIAQQQYGLAQQMFGGRMAGAGAAEQNILGNQANQMANVNRNATDSSQALALAAGLQGQTNNAFVNLATQEGQDKQQKYGMLAHAGGQLINEGDKVYNDKLMKYQQDLDTKNSLISASIQNKLGAAKSFDNQLMAAANMAVGLPPGMLGGGGQGGGGIATGNSGSVGSYGHPFINWHP